MPRNSRFSLLTFGLIFGLAAAGCASGNKPADADRAENKKSRIGNWDYDAEDARSGGIPQGRGVFTGKDGAFVIEGGGTVEGEGDPRKPTRVQRRRR